MSTTQLSMPAFEAVCDFFFKTSGIRLSAAKHGLVAGRLQRLAHEAGRSGLDDYVQWLLHGGAPAAEHTRVIDRLTTNETYFFREPQHFEALTRHLKAAPPAGEFTVWSAASSSGEEAYSIAMLLDDALGARPWSVVGTDLSTAVVQAARRGLYAMDRIEGIPPQWLRRYCLKGGGEYEGRMLIQRALRARVRFECANLMQELPASLPTFDVVFLRNVLIYFDNPAKAAIVRRVLTRLKPGGQLYTGHAESLAALDLPLRPLAPAIYALA
ncbi:CheR family methyltransferase [Azohydromonas aeria]|uniref:CheR family methyltransferase n=1 Tax=Azohydromonas aeria TaxID=2590212 RepID=UPI0012F92CBA|nr:protein-glutamate O-methyltransferase CheR [Azohydromonas aeria]